MEIRHADLQIEVEDAEDGGVLLTIIDSARLSLSLPRKTATELLDAIDACGATAPPSTRRHSSPSKAPEGKSQARPDEKHSNYSRARR